MQNRIIIDSLLINFQNNYSLSGINIIPFSERIFLNKKLLSSQEYIIDYQKAEVRLGQNLKYSIHDTLIVIYSSVKNNFKKEYKHRSLEIKFDDKRLDTLRISKSQKPILTRESLFGKDLQKSGALIRGFTVGTNRDFTLNSGLRLQLTGKLSDDIDLTAALTDENTPIQSEGNTEKLDELDKVFIELKHKNAIGTFGDYDFIFNESEFATVTRKLQGLKGEFQYGNSQGKIAIASSRGKFTSNNFYGQDGNQGPFRLVGSSNEREIIVIAGSERVYIDGQLLKRGENNDYIIDYSNAEVTFSAKRLITSASRIVVEFQYSDQKFKRNFFGLTFSTLLLDQKMKIGVSYFKEGDDENNPIDFTFTDEQLSILKNAGNDRNKAIVTGVSLAPIDSLGNSQGSYQKIDTVINNKNYSYYKYSPGNKKSVFNVSFSYVGTGLGDYIKESLGRYSFAGINQGSYQPIIYIPMPEQKQIGNFFINYNPANGINFNAEISASSYDRNKLSGIDDADNFGYSRKIFFEIQPKEINLANVSLGKIGLSVKDRFVQSKYSSLDRYDDVEFSRNYNLSNYAGDQTLREIKLNLVPADNFTINSLYGYLKQGDQFQSDRFLTQIKIYNPKSFSANYSIDYVQSKNLLAETSWLKQNGDAAYNLGDFGFGIQFLHESKNEKLSASDSLLSSSLRYAEVGPFIKFATSNSFDAKAVVTLREESFPLKGILTKQSNASTEQLQLNYHGIKEIASSLNFTVRNKSYTDEFKMLGMADNQTILLQSQNRFNFWNNFIAGEFYYQATTEQTARLEKVFVKVTKGTGNYIYLGDLNNDGIAEENEFQLSFYDADFIMVTIPTDKLYPVIDLKFNTRWKIDFARMIKNDDIFSSVLKSIATETFWRVDENNKTENTRDIYLLNFSKFLDPANTIRGSQQFQQDVNIFPNSNELSFRLRFNQRKSINQYAGGNEIGYYREKTLRIRFKMIEEMSNQTDVTNETDNMISPITTNRARNISRNSFATDFSYRPIKDAEIGFKVEAARNTDALPSKPAVVDLNSLTIRSTYSFENSGRLRVELERTELSNSSSDYEVPYEVLKGNVIGKNYFWRVFFDYRLSSFVQTSFSYDGRLQGGGRTIHTMRAEARAFF